MFDLRSLFRLQVHCIFAKYLSGIQTTEIEVTFQNQLLRVVAATAAIPLNTTNKLTSFASTVIIMFSCAHASRLAERREPASESELQAKSFRRQTQLSVSQAVAPAAVDARSSVFCCRILEIEFAV